MKITTRSVKSDFPDLDAFEKLYNNAFPENERFEMEQMIKLSEENKLDVLAIYCDNTHAENETFAGLMVSLTDENTAYICYLAVCENMRGKGIGTEILKQLDLIYSGRQIVLETEICDKDAENYSQRVSRQNFYKRNGFEKTPYLIRYKGVTYEIFCAGRKFDLTAFEKLIAPARSHEFDPLISCCDKKFSTYIFDLDGTLLDTLTDLANSVNYALEKFGCPARTREEVRQFVGNGILKLMERATPDGKENPNFDKIFEAFKAHYGEHCSDNTNAYKGINEMLSNLKSNGKKLCIVSNKADFAVKELCRIYFKDIIEIAIGERSDVRKKPAPDTVFTAMKEIGSEPEECVYIGDSDVDIETAKNSGLPCISVMWGFRDEDFLRRHGAAVLAEKPADICRFTGIEV